MPINSTANGSSADSRQDVVIDSVACNKTVRRNVKEQTIIHSHSTWAVDTGQGALISARIIPNASRSGITGFREDALKIKIQAPPEDGRANKMLIEFLSGLLGIPKSTLSVASGEKSRNKKILLRNLHAAKAAEILLAHLHSK